MAGSSEKDEAESEDRGHRLARIVAREQDRLRILLGIGLLACFIAATIAGYLVARQLDQTQWVQATSTLASGTTINGDGFAYVTCPTGNHVLTGGFEVSNITSGYTGLDLLRITGSAPTPQSAHATYAQPGWLVSWYWGGTLNDLATLGLKITVFVECQG